MRCYNTTYFERAVIAQLRIAPGLGGAAGARSSSIVGRDPRRAEAWLKNGTDMAPGGLEPGVRLSSGPGLRTDDAILENEFRGYISDFPAMKRRNLLERTIGGRLIIDLT